MDHEIERKKDLASILDSKHPRKVVVAGPGTGKSFLFEQAIKKKKEKGGKSFLAITFIGKLGDALADDLAGLAETMTLHGFARRLVLKNSPVGWEYYPKTTEIIGEDLALNGITEYKIGDSNYLERTKFYKSVGEDDVVFYALQICKKNPDKIPRYDLILIDEFQDFNEIEAEFIDLLTTKNEVIIVGDDDQALYGFKGSDPKFIREKHEKTNTDFESHTLRFCSRCTEVIICAFHNIVSHYGLNKENNGRIKKDYLYFLPGKKQDSELNPEILVFKDTPPPHIPIKILSELEEILMTQKIKTVLIIGERQSCIALLSYTAKKMKEFGLKNTTYHGISDKVFSFKSNILNGYKILSKEKNEIIAWRLLIEDMSEAEKNKIILNSFKGKEKFIESIPEDFKTMHRKSAKTLQSILTKPASGRKAIADSSIEQLEKQVVLKEKEKRNVFIDQLVNESKNLSRPLVNLEITVCSILGSKGLGADVVFLLGFDQGKLPMKDEQTDSEIYQ